jgi:predicted permease
LEHSGSHLETALPILPNFLLILIGFVLSRKFDYGLGFWEGLEALVYYVLFPALLFRSLALALIAALGLRGVDAGILLLSAALPTASSAYILAIRMAGDGRAVATQITVGTLLSMATIPAWLAELNAG